jgi:hypothetical protein
MPSGGMGKRGGAGRVKRYSGAEGQERREDFLLKIISRNLSGNPQGASQKEKHEEDVLNQ